MLKFKETRKQSYDLDISDIETCVEFIHIYKNGRRVGTITFWNLGYNINNDIELDIKD